MSEGFLTEDEVPLLSTCGKVLYEWPDGGGLYLRVYPSGTRSWIFRYHRREKRVLTLGKWPKYSLEEARRWRRACHLKLRADRRGKDAA